MKQQEIIKKFKEETGYTLEYNNGQFSYGGGLYLEVHRFSPYPTTLP